MMGMQQVVRGQFSDIVLRPAVFSLLLMIASAFALTLDPRWAMALGCLSAAVSFVTASVMRRSALPDEVRHASPAACPREHLQSTFPMALTEGMRILQGHLATLLLGLLATTSMVALLKVGTSVGILIGLPITVLNLMVAPKIARLYATKDHEQIQQLLKLAAAGMTAFTIALTLPFILFGETLLSFVFGAEFAASYPVVMVFCLQAILSGLFGPVAALLNMTGHHLFVSQSAAISLVILLLFAPPLILLDGALGAALAATLSSVVWRILMWRKALRSLDLNASVIPVPGKTLTQ
jgi:O-antigen/teichoic acid export membrane protein